MLLKSGSWYEKDLSIKNNKLKDKMISLKYKEIKLLLSMSKSISRFNFRYKVDLTPYIDEYKFNFDGAYD